ncbi:MAG TPA: carboxypeptidase regulatory-like domain-containing protein [Candidatus Binatus sp.]|nr:carboxypeptidase regulatory-like domain-containing protein [Candidatus Binatus sp.]
MNRPRVSSFLLTLLSVLVLIFAPAVSASPTGSIAGFVKDQSGAVISGAKLTLINASTNAKEEVVSDSNGGFQFLQLAPAVYVLHVEAAGFKKETLKDIVVQVDQITHLDASLQIGSVAETIEVSGAATPLLETDRSTLSNVIDSEVISNIPLNGRQYLDLALLTPGVLPSSTGTQGGGFNVSGARSQSNIFLLDGVSNIDTQINSALGNFRITDAVQEFAVQTSVATAEFGRGTGGQVNIVTKSGTNEFHGTAFEYLRNSVLDARDFFTNKNGGTKNPLHRNQYGGTFGGPVLKDKLFFFASYEGFRQVAPQVSSTRVPTAAERATVTDPISKSLLQFWPAPNFNLTGTTGNNFISNVPSLTFDETGLAKVDYAFSEKDHLSIRWAQYGGTAFTGGAIPLEGGNANAPGSDSGLIDYTHTFSSRVLNEVRFGFSRNKTFITVQDSGLDASKIFVDSSGKSLPGIVNGSTNVLDSGLPTIGISGGYAPLGSTSNLPQGRRTNTYELYDNISWISPFGASKHSFRMGIHVRREDARRFLDGSARGVFNFTSFSDFSGGLNNGVAQVNTATLLFGSTLAYWQRYPWDLYWQDTYKLKDNLTLSYGVRYEYPSAIHQVRNQATNFIPGVGPVLLGTNKVLSIDTTKSGPSSFFFTQAPFTLSDSGTNVDKNNVAPVLGFAYTPRIAPSVFGNDKTVVRGGFRVGYDEIFNNIPANMALNAPFNITTTQIAGVTQPKTATDPSGKFSYAVGLNQNVPLVKNIGQPNEVGLVGLSAEDQNLRSSYIYQYSLGVQRQLGGAFSVEVDYEGSTAHKLGLFVDLNQPTVTVNNPALRGNDPGNPFGTGNIQRFPNPLFGSIGTGVDIGNSNYNSGVVTARYQGRHGLYFEGSYTLGKSIDDGSSFFGSTGERAGLEDRTNLNADRGPSSFDIRHRAVFVYVYDLPIGPGHRFLGWSNGINRQVFGGWQVSGNTTIQSGTPFTVFNSSNDFSGFNQFNDRPDVIGTGRLQQNNSNPDAAFDKTYFSNLTTSPHPGRLGTSGRNQYYGPGLQNWNFSTAKLFPLGTERLHLRFEADFFNLFNHTNFSNPTGSQSSVNFGKITSTLGSGTATAVGTTAGVVGGGPRIIQGSLRLVF